MQLTENLKKLLKEHARLSGERQRHQQMAVSLEAEEANMMETVNLENKAEFEKISQVRLRREIVPKKIKNFQEAADRVEEELAGENNTAISSLRGITQGKKEGLVAELAKALQPFIQDQTKAKAVANSNVYSTDAGQKLWAITDTLVNGNFLSQETIRLAENLIKLDAELGGVQVPKLP